MSKVYRRTYITRIMTAVFFLPLLFTALYFGYVGEFTVNKVTIVTISFLFLLFVFVKDLRYKVSVSEESITRNGLFRQMEFDLRKPFTLTKSRTAYGFVDVIIVIFSFGMLDARNGAEKNYFTVSQGGKKMVFGIETKGYRELFEKLNKLAELQKQI